MLALSAVFPKAVVLIASIVMPADRADINHLTHEPNLEQCWKDAREFVERDLSDAMREAGAVGLKATCGYVAEEREEN